ncbi:hypothetical protein BJ508DRAFT_28801 [Ascobolus immersus RN42]|uniref:DUF7708 domain-containing protein n=1 Tax=Ascobolus immersus RN42 TaxID=1160509 RepID=A0A3N4HSY0_ASCIM|nr:hypothetical protein BJ508DRAFT_28801 [Ascobolus immersus RN42]
MATTSLPQTPLFDDALKKAQDAVARLSAVNPDFKACLASNDTIGDVLDSVKSEVDVFKGEKYNKALEQFNKHTQWIHTIQGAVDAAVQINPVATCPIWAPIKLILIVARGQAAAIDLILEIFECLSDDFRRFKLYIGIIDHDSMRSAIFDFFTDILDFSQIAHKHFKKRAVSKYSSCPQDCNPLKWFRAHNRCSSTSFRRKVRRPNCSP